MTWWIGGLAVAFIIVIAVVAPPPPGRRSRLPLRDSDDDETLYGASLRDPVGRLAGHGSLADPLRREGEGLGEPYSDTGKD